ncbi:MAG: transposase [Thermoplasmatales archaeon]|nr:transposase [Thermoplasmatales archaeon]
MSYNILGYRMHSPQYTHKDIGRLLKKSLKNDFTTTLPLPMADNCTYTKENILKNVIFSITQNVYVAYGSKRLQDQQQKCPSDDDVFYHLNKLNTKQVFSAFTQVNACLLMQAAQHGIFNSPIQCGLDIHKIPWYGKEKDIHVLGMERVRGTNFGHAYASIECVNTKGRFTLAALPLHQFTTKGQMIKYLVTVARNHIEISLLFLDREFFDVESITTLLSLPVQFVIPADHNDTVKELIISAHHQGVNIPGTESYALIRPYTMKKGKQSVTVTLVVILYPSKKPGEPWDEFAYVTNTPVTLENTLELAESYRNRWGIETGYRVKEEVRGKTCSRQYPVRLLFQLLSIFLYNLWQLCNLILRVKLHWNKRRYLVILPEFKDIISDQLSGR